MIFINVKMKEEKKGQKVYDVKYATYYQLKCFLKEVNTNEKDFFNQVQILVDECGIVQTDKNIEEYKKIFYDLTEVKVISDTKESANLLLNLSHSAPKKLNIQKITIFEQIINNFFETLELEGLESIVKCINDSDIDCLKNKCEDVKQTEDTFIKMAKAYNYRFYKILDYIQQNKIIKETQKYINNTYNYNLSYENINTCSIKYILRVLDDAKTELNNLLEANLNSLAKYEYEFAYLDESIFSKNNLIEYVAF